MLTANHEVKIIDFGLCKEISNGNNRRECDCESESAKLDDFVGSTEYACPEILNKEPYYGCKADSWSLGILLYGLLYGQFPFTSYDRTNKFENSLSFPIDVNVSSSAQDLLQSMLTVDPEKRIKVEHILKHKWIKSNPSFKLNSSSILN